MKFSPLLLKNAFIISMDKIEDERGFFARAFCRDEFAEQGLNTKFVQANVAFSKCKGTLRGMHYQIYPFEEVKLVRCIRGKIFDVMIDLREHSPTFTKWYGKELSAEGNEMLYVPEGFAHGYLTLIDNSEVFYQVSQFYSPEHEKGVLWNDPAFAIKWPKMKNLVISGKDKSWQAIEQQS